MSFVNNYYKSYKISGMFVSIFNYVVTDRQKPIAQTKIESTIRLHSTLYTVHSTVKKDHNFNGKRLQCNATVKIC